MTSLPRFLGFFGSKEEDKSGRRDKPVDLTEDNDDEVEITSRSQIQISPLLPSLPPRPSGLAGNTDLRLKIDDPYPDPPASVRPPTATNLTRRFSDTRHSDEHRLLGNYRAPKDATPIQIPGQERLMPGRKPGAASSFQPRYTLNDVRYQGTTRTGNVRTGRTVGAESRYPTSVGLALETSRGGNVRSIEHEFPVDRPAKRARVDQTSKNAHPRPSSMSRPGSVGMISDDDRGVPGRANGLSRSRQSPTVQVTRARQREIWEVSGTQEFNRVEQRLDRPKRTDTLGQDRRMSTRVNGQPSTTTRPRPSHSEEVYEISDDEQPQSQQGLVRDSRHLSPRRAKRPAEDDDEAVESSARNVHGEHNKVVSDYFAPKSGRPRKATRTAVMTDAVTGGTATQPVQTSFKERVDQVMARSNPVDETQGRQSMGNSTDELATEQKPPTSPRKSSPMKQDPGNAPVTMAGENAKRSDDEDELHGGIPPSFHNGKTVGTVVPGPAEKRTRPVTKFKKGWAVEELVEPDGRVHKQYHFLNLDIITGREARFLVLRDPQAPAGDNELVVSISHIRSIQWSKDSNCPILRIESPGNDKPVYDIKFHDHDQMVDFAAGLEMVTVLKGNNPNRSKDHMEKIYGHRIRKPSADKAVDSGVEEKLLERRVMQKKEPTSARAATEGGRPRIARTLISQMKAQDPESEILRTEHTKLNTSALSRSDNVEGREEAEGARTAANRPVRSTRGRKARSPTPEIHYDRYSKIHGLGSAWDQPLVYPEVGKKRVTVDFKDLERLDDGEFINDNLLEWYMRWLQENIKVKEKTVYFFNTHFYSGLTNLASMPRGQRNTINFSAVERWTAKDDIFSHDFVVVPVNEMLHWYLAIICNLPNVQRKLAGDDVDVVETVSAKTSDVKGTSSQPVDLSESTQPEQRASEEAESDEVAVATSAEVLTKKYGDLKLASSSPQPPSDQVHENNQDLGNALKVENEEAAVKPKVFEENDPPRQETVQIPIAESSQPNDSQVSGVFTNASTPTKKKGKRKSGPPPRKYDTEQPMIVILDPMGTGHGRTISNLKDYLVQEGTTKRGMALDKNMFQGLNARSGIPQQDNFYDCGIYVCGYLHKFMADPKEFGEKLISQEFDRETDWPEMKPERMRANMRNILQELAAEQQAARAAKKAQKRARKQSEAANAGASAPKLPVVPVTGDFVDLSSPAKPRDNERNSPQAVEDMSRPEGAATENTRELSRQASPSKANATAIQRDDEDEMLFQPKSSSPPTKLDLLSPLEEHLGLEGESQEEKQNEPELYIPDSQSQNERDPTSQNKEEIKVFEDEPVEVLLAADAKALP